MGIGSSEFAPTALDSHRAMLADADAFSHHLDRLHAVAKEYQAANTGGRRE
jgi:hypothetical protein